MASIIKADTLQSTTANVFVLNSSGTEYARFDSSGVFQLANPTTFPAGTAALPSITATGDTNTGLYFPAADTIAFTEGGVEAMRINSSGNVGIGTASPSSKFNVVGGRSFFAPVSENYAVGVKYVSTGGAFYFGASDGSATPDGVFSTAGGAERMRITNDGNLLVGTTSTLGAKFALYGTASGTNSNIQITNPGIGTGCLGVQGTSSNFKIYNCYSSGTLGTGAGIDIDTSGNVLVGTTSASGRLTVKGAGTTSATSAIYITNSAGAYTLAINDDGAFYTGASPAGAPYNNTTASAANVVVTSSGLLQRSTSSLKYKTDIQNSTHGLSDALKLRAVTYKGKNDGETIFGGLIAEEVHEAGLTEFVQYAEDGSPDALNYGNMVSLAFKAIQEQQALITQLTARITALEGA